MDVKNSDIAKQVFFDLYNCKVKGAAPALCYEAAAKIAAYLFQSGGRGEILISQTDAELLILNELKKFGCKVSPIYNYYSFNFDGYTEIKK